MEKMAEEYGKTSVQKKYLEKKYNEIKLPVEYESYSSWDTMIMYVETYSIILAIIVGFICAGIFADDFQTKADAVFFSTKYGRTKAVKTKILAGIATTVMIYCMGIILLSVICFGIMGTSGMNTPYQMYQAYSIYIMSYGQYYLLTVVCGFIASMLAAVVSMLVAAKMHTISVAVCIPFFFILLIAIYRTGTFWVYNAFQFDTNNFDKCTGKCKSPTYLSDWELCISTNSACNGNVYSDGNSLTAFYL